MTMQPTGRAGLAPQSAILGGSVSPWQPALAALFSGLSAAGQPGGWSNFGAGVAEGAQNFQQGQSQQQLMDLRQQQIQQQQEEMRVAGEDRARAEAARQKLAALFAPTPSGPAGPDERQPGQSAILSGLDPQTSALLQQYGQINPEGALNLVMEQRFAKPSGPESTLGKLAADLKAGRITPAEYDAAVKKENYISYPQGPGPTERHRNAVDAGLIPGTKEFQDFMLGKDLNNAQGPYPGTATDATDMNIILRGQQDPAYRGTPEFAGAWNRQYEQPKIITTPDPSDPTRLVQMQILMPKPQGFQGPRGAQPAPAPGPGPQTDMPAAPPMQPGPQSSQASVIPGTSTVPQKEAVDLRKFEAEADAMLSALDTFDATVEKATTTDFVDALAGGYTEGGRKLATDWANAALLSKAESLYNLGVLNGPDLEIIRNTLTDPSTIKGQFTTIDAYKAATKSIRKLITDRINTKRKGMNLAPRDSVDPSDPLGIRKK